jgi:hypothetical protein
MLIVILLTRKDKNHECSLLLIRGRVLDRGAIKTHLSREIVGPSVMADQHPTLCTSS